MIVTLKSLTIAPLSIAPNAYAIVGWTARDMYLYRHIFDSEYSARQAEARMTDDKGVVTVQAAGHWIRSK